MEERDSVRGNDGGNAFKDSPSHVHHTLSGSSESWQETDGAFGGVT